MFPTKTIEQSTSWGSCNPTKIELIALQRSITRGESLDILRDEPWKILPPSLVCTEDEMRDNIFAVMAAENGCPVAPRLSERERGNSIDSYFYKAMAFRFMHSYLKATKRPLAELWVGNEQKEPHSHGVLQLLRPDFAKEEILYGKEKLACFFISNLFKTLEYLRLNLHGVEITDPTTLDGYKIHFSDEIREKLRLPWKNLVPVTTTSDNLLDLAAEIAVTTYEKLIDEGITKKIALMIIAHAYNPMSQLLEKGEICKNSYIWSKITSHISKTDGGVYQVEGHLFRKATERVYELSQPI